MWDDEETPLEPLQQAGQNTPALFEETPQQRRLRELCPPDEPKVSTTPDEIHSEDNYDVSGVLAAYDADEAKAIRPLLCGTSPLTKNDVLPIKISLEGRALKDLCTKLTDLMVSRGDHSLVEAPVGTLKIGDCEPVEVRDVKLRFSRDESKSVYGLPPLARVNLEKLKTDLVPSPGFHEEFYNENPRLPEISSFLFKNTCPLCQQSHPIKQEHNCDPPGVVSHGAGSRLCGWDAEGWYCVLYETVRTPEKPGEIFKMKAVTKKLREVPSALWELRWELRGAGEFPWDKAKPGAEKTCRTVTYYDDYAKVDHPKGESAQQVHSCGELVHTRRDRTTCPYCGDLVPGFHIGLGMCTPKELVHTLPSGRKLTLGGPLRPIVIFDNKEEMLRRACEYYGDAEGDESTAQYLSRNNLIARQRVTEDRWEVVPREGHAAHAIIAIPNSPVKVDVYGSESVFSQIETQTKNTGMAMVRKDSQNLTCKLCLAEVSIQQYLEKGHGCKEGRAFDLEFANTFTDYLEKKNRDSGRRVLAMEGEDRLARVREDGMAETHVESTQAGVGSFGRLPELPEGPGPYLLQSQVCESGSSPGSDAEGEPEEISGTEACTETLARDLEQLRALRDAAC